jgi:hypothetical protein
MFVLNVKIYYNFLQKKKKFFFHFSVQDWGAHFWTGQTSDRPSDLGTLLREVQLRYVSCCFIFFIFFSLYHIACIFHTLNYTNNLPHTVCTQDRRAHTFTHIYYIQIHLFRVSDLGARQLANISYFLSFCFFLFFTGGRPYTPGVSHLCLTPWRESRANWGGLCMQTRYFYGFSLNFLPMLSLVQRAFFEQRQVATRARILIPCPVLVFPPPI